MRKRLELVSKARKVADPLYQMSAAGLAAEGLSGLGIARNGPAGKFGVMNTHAGYSAGFPSLNVLMKRYMSMGMSQREARIAALKFIYAQNMAGKRI